MDHDDFIHSFTHSLSPSILTRLKRRKSNKQTLYNETKNKKKKSKTLERKKDNSPVLTEFTPYAAPVEAGINNQQPWYNNNS